MDTLEEIEANAVRRLREVVAEDPYQPAARSTSAPRVLAIAAAVLVVAGLAGLVAIRPAGHRSAHVATGQSIASTAPRGAARGTGARELDLQDQVIRKDRERSAKPPAPPLAAPRTLPPGWAYTSETVPASGHGVALLVVTFTKQAGNGAGSTLKVCISDIPEAPLPCTAVADPSEHIRGRRTTGGPFYASGFFVGTDAVLDEWTGVTLQVGVEGLPW